MNALTIVLVCLLGGLGSGCRYAVDSLIREYWKRAFPLSTFTINLVAGFFAGVVFELATKGSLDNTWHMLLATGFLGGFSTFSTAINEMILFARKRQLAMAGYYAFASLVMPLTFAVLGVVAAASW